MVTKMVKNISDIYKCLLRFNPNAEIIVETGDCGPCVDFNYCTTIETYEDDPNWFDKDELNFNNSQDLKVKTVRYAVEAIEEAGFSKRVTVSDGFDVVSITEVYDIQELKKYVASIQGATLNVPTLFPKFPVVIFDV